MELLFDLLPTKRNSRLPKYQWQELALDIIKDFKVENKDRSSVFKWCQKDYQKALQSFAECKELKKLHAKYFFKLMSL